MRQAYLNQSVEEMHLPLLFIPLISEGDVKEVN